MAIVWVSVDLEPILFILLLENVSTAEKSINLYSAQRITNRIFLKLADSNSN